jgi:hypothetical protein
MKIPVFIVVLVFCFHPVFSQQQSTEPRDTTLGLLRMTDPSMLLAKPITILPLTFALVVPEQNTQMSLYQTFAGTPQSFSWNHPAEIDLTAPLKLQLYQSETEKAVRITLGAAQTAGALYLAYRHLKKYGLK